MMGLDLKKEKALIAGRLRDAQAEEDARAAAKAAAEAAVAKVRWQKG